jgi:eukaryotic-like serine/threonine-protein kinase
MLRFGAFEVVPPKRLLLRDGVPLPLTPKAFDTLLVLLERRDRVVSKDELLSALWPDTVVEEATLSQHIYKIRKALNDEDGVRYIATIPRRGYRFVADVVETDAGRPSADGTARPTSTPVPTRRRRWIPIAILAAAAPALAWLWLAGRSGSEALPIRFTIPAPPGTRLAQLAISPDGQSVVFQAVGAAGSGRLWLRRLDSLASQPIDGTEDGDSPFWSPDGRAIGFFANRKLRTISVAGGASEAICEVSDARGGTWNRDDDIVFAPTSRSGLFRVSARGGPVTPVTQFDPATAAVSQRWPVFLPDQRHFLYLQMGGRTETRGVYAGSLDGGPPTRLLADDSSAIYAPDGYLLFGRDNSLLAMPFDARRLRVFGESTPIASGVGRFVSMYMPVTVSSSGRLVYEARDRRSQFVWRQRDGQRVDRIGEPIRQGDPVANARGSEVLSWKGSEAEVNLWLDDVSRRTTTRITFSGQDVLPVLSPDGDETIFRSNRNGGGDLYRKSLRRTDPEVLVLKSATRNDPTDWSPDGRYLLYDNYDVGETHTTSDIWVLPLSGDIKPSPYAASPFAKWAGRFSPDGRSVAYVADDTGRPEVYVQAFPATSDRWRVSTAGGDDPQWRRDGGELFFVAPDGMLSAVAVTGRGPSIEFSAPQPLFQIPLKYSVLRNRYAVGADGTRFLVDTPMDEETAAPLTVVVNWRAGLR